jgi:hypothetical protein
MDLMSTLHLDLRLTTANLKYNSQTRLTTALEPTRQESDFRVSGAFMATPAVEAAIHWILFKLFGREQFIRQALDMRLSDISRMRKLRLETMVAKQSPASNPTGANIMRNETALQDIAWFGPGNEDRRSLNYPPEQKLEVVLKQGIAADSDSGTSARTNAPSDQEEQDFNEKQKTKKQKETPISLGEQLLGEKVITAEQLEQSLAQQGRTGESLIRILVRSRFVRLSHLEPYVKIGDLRKFAVLDLENDYYQGTLRIMLIHRRNFRLFLGVCALTMLAAVWLHDQIQAFGYLFALAAMATVYHRIQRRYYDLQAFFKQSRTTVLNALDSCTTVGELSIVRDYARAGFATVVPMGYQDGSSGSVNRRPLDVLGPALLVVFVALLLLGAINPHAGLRLPGLSQDTMEAQSFSVKRLISPKLSGQ